MGWQRNQVNEGDLFLDPESGRVFKVSRVVDHPVAHLFPVEHGNTPLHEHGLYLGINSTMFSKFRKMVPAPPLDT